MRNLILSIFALSLFLLFQLPLHAGSPDYPRLVQQIANYKDVKAYENAAKILGNTEDTKAEAALRNGLRDKNPQVRAKCVELLTDRRVTDANTIIKAALADTDENVGIAALFATRKNPKPAMLEWLRPLMKDSREKFRAVVMGTLGKFGADGEALALAALTDNSARVRSSAVSALRECGSAKAVKPLAEMVPTGDRSLRIYIFRAFQHIGAPAFDTLCRFATEGELETRLQAIDALKNLEDPRTREFLETALKDPTPQIRAAALPSCRSDSEYAFPILYAALRDPDTDVQHTAFNYFFNQFLDERAVDPLIALLDSPDENIQLYAADYLQTFPLPRVADALFERLKRPNCPPGVVEALGKMGDQRIIPELIKRITTPVLVDEHIRFSDIDETHLPTMIRISDSHKEAYQALCAIGEPAIAPLIQTAASPDPRIKQIALDMLGTFDDQRARKVILAAVNDPNKDIRKTAIRALGDDGGMHDASAYPALIAALNDPDESVRSSAAYGLMGCQDPRIVSPLTRLFHSREYRSRYNAAVALAEMNDQRVIPLCCEALRDRDDTVRVAAACGEGSWKNDPRAIEALIQCISADGTLSANASNQLVYLPPDKVVPMLTRSLRSKNSASRQQIMYLFSQIHDHQASLALISSLKDSDDKVRSDAEDFLDEWCAPEGLPALRALLQQSRYPEARLAAMRVLSKMGAEGAEALRALPIESISDLPTRLQVMSATKDPRALQSLQNALKSTDEKIRTTAAQGLGKLGDPRGVDMLLAAIHDYNSDTGYYAGLALGELKSPDSVDKLIAMLHDEKTRPHSAIALGDIGEKRATDALFSLLPTDINQAADGEGISWIIDALVKLGDRRVADRLLEYLRSWKTYVPDSSEGNCSGMMRVCLIALGNLRDPRAIDYCALSLRYYPDDSIVAVDTLCNIGGDRAVDTLIAADDVIVGPYWWEHENIAAALGKITAEHLQQKFEAAMRSPRWRLRHLVVLALKDRKEPWAVPMLTAALNDPQPQVSNDAKDALAKR